MKKVKKEEQSPKNSRMKLFDKIAQTIGNAIEEGRQEAIAEYNLTCLKNGTVDFDLIEEDVHLIHRNLEIKGSRVLVSYLTLDDQRNLMEIKTYTEKEGRTYETLYKVKVQEIRNLPDEVLDKLNKNKRVELIFD